MIHGKIGLLLLMLCVIGDGISSDDSTISSVNTTEKSPRSGRKNNVYFTPPVDYNLKNKQQPVPDLPSKKDEHFPSENDSEKNPLFPPSSNYGEYPAFYKPKPKYVPEDTSMYKSGSNLNWNVWKGDSSESAEFEPPAVDMKGMLPLPPSFGSFSPPAPWKDSTWDKDKMAAMILMMKDLQEAKPKPSSGFLSKLKTDPSTLLLVSAIPISILLAAVLPTLMSNMMSTTPSVSTTATGNRGRMLFGNDLFAPILDGVSTFGYRALENPGCMQRIFCQVTKGDSGNDTNPRVFQRALHTASAFVDDNFLESYGVKDLFRSMSDGNCEKVPCTNFNLTDYVLKFISKPKKE